jgi:hypothetical protein
MVPAASALLVSDTVQLPVVLPVEEGPGIHLARVEAVSGDLVTVQPLDRCGAPAGALQTHRAARLEVWL